ncbi:metallophosphoesterase family protein [Brachybacterium sp. AOP25-B2-12]|uniref:metallophosphoesterase family protein n=1 Tax=Brachybacterium sp. AOP25-B2-12 TaxID=3457710 RepID=UPI004034785A
MRILQLTDTHLYGDPAARHYGRIDSHAALVSVLDRLAGLEDVDLVLHTGDASEDGTAESYRRLHALLDPFAAALGAPLLVTMGNHDVSAEYRALVGPGDHGGDAQDRTRMLASGLQVIVLDSSVPGAGYGHLDPEQLTWLAAQLARPAPGGTVLAIHHPPLVAATRLLRGLDLDGLDELADVLDGSDVRAVLSGHYHHEMTGEIAGIPVHVAPGTTNVVDPLAAGGQESALPLSGASMLELPEGGGAPIVTTSVWPNAGDVLGEPATPVYAFGAAQVEAIVADAGR